MKRILLAQQSGVIKLPHYLTFPIAHKTGETGTATNGVGMGRVARLVVDYFDGVLR